LLSDAGHNLSDVLGLVVAWAGAMMARTGSSPRFTYGLKKASILAALANAIFLLVAVGAIVAEAIRRLMNPEPTQGSVVMAVAAVGILVNGATALLFQRGRDHDINIRGAFLHMAADALVSVGVVGAGYAILVTGKSWIDPVVSLAVAAAILWGTMSLLKESVWMSLAGVPSGIDVAEVQSALAGLDGVEAVHDLHVWPMSTTENALTAHLFAPKAGRTDDLLAEARAMIDARFGIHHSTLQIETVDTSDCEEC
jgi:cobalt-zinc-cadmium efflux system protein